MSSYHVAFIYLMSLSVFYQGFEQSTVVQTLLIVDIWEQKNATINVLLQFALYCPNNKLKNQKGDCLFFWLSQFPNIDSLIQNEVLFR